MPSSIIDFDPIEHPDLFAVDGERIVYLRTQRSGAPKSYLWSDPEEKVRAWFYYELATTFSYPPERIDLEVEVYRRKPEDFADLVIYEDDGLRQPFLAAECKSEELPVNDFEQAVKQAWGNANNLGAPFACTTTGLRTVCFEARSFSLQDSGRSWINLPERYGAPIKYRYVKGDPEFDLREASLSELRQRFQQCHDALWEGGRRNPAQAFDEMTKLMFCKLQDERGGTYDGDPYGFQVGSNETPSEVGARVRAIFDRYKIAAQNVFKSSFDIRDELIFRVVGTLQEISLYKSDLDAKGKALEKFLYTVFRGEMGQYFTPRSVVKFMVDVMQPSIRDKIIDPACGSGGFLLYALEHIQKFAEQRFHNPIDQRDYWRDWALRGLYGIEVNDQISRVAMMGMILHEDGHSNIVAADALLPFDTLARANAELRPATFHKLLTNPPFGSLVSRISDGATHHYLDLYALGRGKKSQRTELLFLERCLDFLIPGGRMGIVVPEGLLNNPSLRQVRAHVEERAFVDAVISLPIETFASSGASVKASILFLQKFKDSESARVSGAFTASLAEVMENTKAKRQALRTRKAPASEIAQFDEQIAAESRLRVRMELDYQIGDLQEPRGLGRFVIR